VGIVIAILVFGLIIFVHELGHFMAARLNGIKVHEFSLGLGPTIIGKEFKGTKFSLKALPLGGACVMGEDDVDDDSQGSFNSKSVWRRFTVIAAGSFMNLLLALILCIITIAWIGFTPPVIGGVVEDSPAAEMGIEAGDTFTRMNGRAVRMWDDILLYNLMNLHGEPMEITFIRDGQRHDVTIQPMHVVENGRGRYMLGIYRTDQRVYPGFFATIGYGAHNVQFWVNHTIQSVRMLIVGDIGVDQVAGPVGIVQIVDDTYQASVEHGISTVILSLMSITILLSATIGVMNLLPLPALDGGRLVFIFLEMIRGKRVPPEKEGVVHFVGIAILLALMVFIIFNDIRRIVSPDEVYEGLLWITTRV
jgi:regulator of sigma E protease